MRFVVTFLLALTLGACSKHSDAPSGVTMGTQVPDRIVNDLRKRGTLPPNEELLAYYDYTLSLDGTEVAFVTPERVVYAKGAKVTAFLLADVSDVQLRDVALIGDVLDVKTSTGRFLKIEIAPLNDGAQFANVLEEAWQRKKAGAAIRRVPR